MHRRFPAIKEIYRDYWVGSGEPIQIEEGLVEWPISFGIGSLRRKFGRLIDFNCPHVFAGGADSDCSYDPTKGIGIPELEILHTALSVDGVQSL